MLPCFPVPKLCKPLALPSFTCASLVHIFHSKAATTTPKLSLTSPKNFGAYRSIPFFPQNFPIIIAELLSIPFFFFGRRNLKHKNIISQLNNTDADNCQSSPTCRKSASTSNVSSKSPSEATRERTPVSQEPLLGTMMAKSSMGRPHRQGGATEVLRKSANRTEPVRWWAGH